MNGFKTFAAFFACEQELDVSKKDMDAIRRSYAQCIDACSLAGGFTGSDGAKVALVAVRLKSASFAWHSESTQRRFFSRLLPGIKADASLTAIYREGESVWRLSYVRKMPDFEEKGVKLEFTPVKRTSFLVGGSMPSHGARQMLLQLFRQENRAPSLQEIGQVFSRSAVIRRFINDSAKKIPEGQAVPHMLSHYGFTAYEGMPDDEVAAVDGYALGALLEALMGEKARKRSGTYYTPPEIVRYMCIESLSNYLATKTDAPIGELRVFLQYGEWLAGENRVPESILRRLAEMDEALESVRVLDPAAGSGAFPVCMLNEIVKARSILAELRAGSRHETLSFNFRFHAIQNCIHAADINETAVHLTKMRLWLSLACEYDPASHSLPAFSDFKCNTVCGNSLMDDLGWPDGYFDIIIGNPPYISAVEASKRDRSMREALKGKFPLLKGAFDVYAAFLLDGMEKTKAGGAYCWIVPNKLLVSDYAAPVLRCLKKNGLRRIISISCTDAFSGTGVYPVIISGHGGISGYGEQDKHKEHKKRAKRGTGEGCAKQGRGEEYVMHGECEEYVSDSLQDLAYGCFKPKIRTRCYKTFADAGIRFASGAAGFQARRLSASLDGQAGSGRIPFIVSGSVDKYTIRYDNVRYMGKTYDRAYISRGEGISAKKWEFWRGEKIVIAGLTKHIEAFYCGEPLALGVGVYAISGFAGFDPLYLLGLLNSKFLSWYLNIRFREKHLAGGYLAVNKSTLEQLPLAEGDEKARSEIAESAGYIQELLAARKCESAKETDIRHMRKSAKENDIRHMGKSTKENGKRQMDKSAEEAVRKQMDRIDEIVYRLYRPSDSEIREAEQYFKA